MQQLLACLNFLLNLEDLFCCTNNKNDFYQWRLTWYLPWGIYASIPTWTHSQNSLAAVEALSIKISFLGISLKWSHEDCPNQHENSNKLCNETGNPVVYFMENQCDQDFQMEGKPHCRTNNIRRKKEIQKSRTMRITVWDPSREVNHLNNVIWDRKIITEFTE